MVQRTPNGKRRMTGLDIAKLSTAHVLVFEGDGTAAYHWPSHTIWLSPAIAFGRGVYALLVAAEEVAHSQQPAWKLRLTFWKPMEWHVEADAFVRAKEILKSL